MASNKSSSGTKAGAGRTGRKAGGGGSSTGADMKRSPKQHKAAEDGRRAREAAHAGERPAKSANQLKKLDAERRAIARKKGK